MRTTIIIIAVLLNILPSFAQNEEVRVFNLTPISKNVSKVNGMAFGIGHLLSSEQNTAVINGLNLEVNPLAPFILLVQDPGRMNTDSVKIITNGLHLSIGGFSGGAIMNGVGVSVYNITAATNGFSITGLYNSSNKLNGVHIAGLANSADNKGTGALIAPFNFTGQFTGLQLGIYNHSDKYSGLQIGLVNRAKTMRGLQVGLWNINEKRSLPFINW